MINAFSIDFIFIYLIIQTISAIMNVFVCHCFIINKSKSSIIFIQKTRHSHFFTLAAIRIHIIQFCRTGSARIARIIVSISCLGFNHHTNLCAQSNRTFHSRVQLFRTIGRLKSHLVRSIFRSVVKTIRYLLKLLFIPYKVSANC